ncbi:MAG: class A beta-lactamase-related serine hydrolase [Gemmatimonadota bacterium]|nr:class A beta-lactamase-related serine hydrolase [Gemmatimonadota bacterium]
MACAQSTGKATEVKQTLLWRKLETEVARIDRAHDGVMGVVIRDLTSGDELLINADEIFPTASTIKIAVLAELYRQAKSGRVKLTDLYVVRAEDVVGGSDIVAGLTPGITRITYRDLATMMVAVSDNSATNILIDRIGTDSVNAMLARFGLRETRLRRKMMDLKAAAEGRENTATPREIVALLDSLYRNRLVDSARTADFFAVLSTHKDSYIPRLLPEEVRIANKPGWLEAVRNDCGIVFVPRRPFAICVMTTFDRDEHASERAIAEIGMAAYGYFDRVARASRYGRVVSPR